MTEWHLTHPTLDLHFTLMKIMILIPVQLCLEVPGGIINVTIPTLTETTEKMEQAML